MFKKHNSNESVLVKQRLGLLCKLTSYNIRCNDKNMLKKDNSTESVVEKQRLGLPSKLTSYNIRCNDKNMLKKDNSTESVVERQTLSVKSSREVLEAKYPHTISIALRNQIRIKSEIEATTNSPISCLKHDAFGYGSMIFILFKN